MTQFAIPHIPFDLSVLPQIEEVYLVGGTVRDLLLGQMPMDYDIAVSQNPEIFAETTAARCRGRCIRMGRPGKESYRVVFGKTILDITGLNDRDIRQDLKRRDFTINAMAVELPTGKLLDWVGGRKDLAEKRVRMVSANAFRDDPVRLLRTFRLAAVLGFSVEPATLSAARRDADRIRFSAGERIRSELYQLLSCRNSAPQVAGMAKTGLLAAIFSERKPGDRPGVNPQSQFPDAYRFLEHLLNNPPFDFPPDEIIARAPWLKFTNLLSLAGKYGGAHLPEGESVSWTMDTCRRLRLSANEANFVSGIVAHRDRIPQLYEDFLKERLTRKAVTRFFMLVNALAPSLLLLTMAGTFESHPDRPPETSFSDFARYLLCAFYDTYLPKKAVPPFVTGRDLITVFGLSPSPFFNTILTRLEEERLSGEIADRQSALKTAGEIIQAFIP